MQEIFSLLWDINVTVCICSALMITPKGNYSSRQVNSQKSLIKLTSLQTDVLVGILLGDASLERRKSTHNTRLRFDQTFPGHASYLMMLYGIYYNLTLSGPTLFIRKPDKRTGNVYSSLAFKTISLPCLNEWHSLFYPEGIKVVPDTIADLLTARALAYFIIDDGGKGSHGEMNLHTRSYTLQEVQLLQEALRVNLSLKTRLVEKKLGQWIIVIPVNQILPLRHIVLPYTHSSMLYKL